ncbi:oligosaccharide flippase family protein [Limosilactobacillus mucosae]|uniref:Oligosaccharide flippase family protein n=1 Tax=Limosilactobacillus mucosae TaxID=97478 RepID=A0AAJ1M837_LIMMU|nr:oligosaccharide flippase family protein [Limosilactobacillus mucosae]MDC2828777.1 oligosaccharide flippase family protein [Limosilactobacillus mucosae]MDC2836632.1 oligosaccharide flippase family protein [Limosilactobacillus mucosae]MDC2848812.1 oligosaccharide flippase family protein [Limosilactobacillus mucosae]MDC2854364.1 oligosaccharide flippase family protein [Limosilactobacillus mucosae]
MRKKVRSFLLKYNKMSVPLKASLWYTISNILVKGISLLSTPIFTRVMSQDQYGTFTLFQSWFNIILIFTSLNIFLGGYTKGMLIYKDDIAGYTASSLFQTAILTCFFGIIYLLKVNFWTNFFGLSPFLMLMMFIELLTSPAYEFWASQARFEYKYQKVVAISFISSVMSIVLGVVAVVYTTRKVEARVVSDVFAKAFVALPLLLLILWKGKKFFVKEYWKFNFNFNIPLIPHYLSNYALNQSDRVMIGKIIGNAQAAQYSVAYTISMMMALVTTALNNAMTPYIYQSIDGGHEDDIKETLTPIFFLVAVLCIITMAFAPEIVLVFAGKNYMPAVYIIPPVAASVFFIFLYSMFSTIEYFYQKTVQIAIATVIAAVLNVGLNYIFINLYGYYAAGYITLLSYIVLAFMHFVFYKIIVKDKFGKDKQLYDHKAILLSSVIVLVAMVIMIFTYRSILIRYSVIMLFFILGILKRKKIKKIINSFKKA